MRKWIMSMACHCTNQGSFVPDLSHALEKELKKTNYITFIIMFVFFTENVMKTESLSVSFFTGFINVCLFFDIVCLFYIPHIPYCMLYPSSS